MDAKNDFGMQPGCREEREGKMRLVTGVGGSCVKFNKF